MKAFADLDTQIKGFLDPREGQRLYQTACEAAAIGPCLEIGSYCGKSALCIARACKEHGTVLFSIDHHLGSEEQQPGEDYFDPELFDARTFTIDTLVHFRRTLRLADLEDVVVPMVCRSEVAARAWATPLSLVFIDGGHSYEAVDTDYQCWARHILPGGFLLMHDLFPDAAKGGQGPYQVYAMACGSGLFHELPMTETLGVLQRKA